MYLTSSLLLGMAQVASLAGAAVSFVGSAVVDSDAAPELALTGVAGVLCWLWLTDRKQSAQDREMILQSHRQIMEDRIQLKEIINVVQQDATTENAHANKIDELIKVVEQQTEVLRHFAPQQGETQ